MRWKWIVCGAVGIAALEACGSRGPIDLDRAPASRDAGVVAPDVGGAGPDAGSADAGSRDAAADAGGRDGGAADAGGACLWEPFSEGVDGAAVTVVERDPRPLGALYAASAGRLYTSADGGGSWALLAELPTAIYAIAFPDSPASILLGTGDGVWASDDRGLTFAPLSLRGLLVGELEAHPASRDRVFAAVNALGILRSGDGGATWTAASRGLEPATYIARIDGDPRDPDVALAASILTDPISGGFGEEGQLLRTTDGGATWSELDRTRGRPYELRRCEADPDVVLSARRWGLFRSSDGGATFTRLSLPGDTIAFGVDVSGPGCDEVAAFGGHPLEGFGMYVSADGGDRFEGAFLDGLALARSTRSYPIVRFGGEGRVILGTSSGLRVSEDGGRAYRSVGGLGGFGVTALEVSEGQLWAGTFGAGLWVLERDATRWARIPVEALDNDYQFSVFPRDGAGPTRGDVLVGTYGPLVGRLGGADRFTIVPNPGPSADNVFGFALLDDGTILIASQTEGIQRSEDGGRSFVDSSAGLSPWPTPAGAFADFRTIAVDPERDAVLAGAVGRGVWRSVDRGRSWAPTTLRDEAVVALLVAGSHRRTYALLEGEGVVVSVDGLAWSSLVEGLASLDVSGIVEDPAIGRVYLSAGGRIYTHDGPRVEGPCWRPFDDACSPRGARLPRVLERPDGRWLFVATRDGLARHPL
jgi:photosystem II stability/assembly factor-like uncharacterized protein